MSRVKPKYFNRELSWLEFNQRVLDEAADPQIPLLERLRFLAITASNLDEFFRVRVGGLQMLDRQAVVRPDSSGLTPREQLDAIRDRVRRMTADQHALYAEQLEPQLAAQGLRRLKPEELTPPQREVLRQIFENEIFPILTPIAATSADSFPLLANQTLAVCVRIKERAVAEPTTSETPQTLNPVTPLENVATEKAAIEKAATEKLVSGKVGKAVEPSLNLSQPLLFSTPGVPVGELVAGTHPTPPPSTAIASPGARFAISPFGPAASRILSLPAELGSAHVLLEDAVSMFVDQFFEGEKVQECVPFRITRNADIRVREDSAADLLAGMVQVLDERRQGDCIRLEVDDRASELLHRFLQECLEMMDDEIYRLPGPLDLSTFSRLADRPGFDTLKYETWPPQPSPDIPPGALLFDVMAAQDLLLYHPYESFDPIVRFLEEAANDPDVLAIKQTLYRTSRNSPIVESLRKAAQRGKHVTAVVELKARFDEARNIEWARQLEQAGAHVVYGVKGLKTHAKVCLVIRREPQGIQRYVHFGTGNYNETTARIYSDASLLTSDADLGADAVAFFNAITGYSQPTRYRKIEAAPLGLRDRLLEMIRTETERKKQDQTAKIFAKFNALVDPVLIDALYEASQAGVQIKLNIRGTCCLKPGVKKLSENIEVVSVVDRFLEHARILYFHHGGDDRVFISSADWMPRNLDGRVELLIPVEDPRCRDRLLSVLETYFDDNVKSRRLLSDGSYKRLVPGKQEPVRSQRQLFEEARLAKQGAEHQQRTVFEPHRRNS